MRQRPGELQAVLSAVRVRLTRLGLLRAWTVGAAASTTVLAAGGGVWLTLAREGLPLLVLSVVVVAMAGLAMGLALWASREVVSDRRVARLIEERFPDLDDVLVTAVDLRSRPDPRAGLGDAVMADAGRALGGLDLEAVVPRRSLRAAAQRALVATGALVLIAALFAPAVFRAGRVASAYLFPHQWTMEVMPGSVKVREGAPLTITARLGPAAPDLIPTLTMSAGGPSQNAKMRPTQTAGTFEVTVDDLRGSFTYAVSVAGVRSGPHAVTVIRPPRVERIDLRYAFPRGLGLADRTDDDSGDVYGPLGTRVQLTVTADKAVAKAELVLDDGSRVPLDGASEVVEGGLTIDGDGGYRVALVDHDGLENPGDTEYFIRTLDDRPPDVRILRPASDRHVTPLEEVSIEARADDDFGVASLDLVVQRAGGKERVVPLGATRGALVADGQHTLFMEELGVQPGDFVAYYARARDVSRGRRSTEARSDIFFLEVKPFEEEFVAAQSQALGQGGGMQGNTGLEGLVDAQKEIIVATWKLDARGRRALGSSSADVRAVSKAQADVRTRAERAGAQAARGAGDPRRRRGMPAGSPGDDPVGRAVEAMGRAIHELDKPSTSEALPHEMEALNQLLIAAAEIRRRQVTRQQRAGAGGGGNRSDVDLSSLFDQELRRRQQTNYESPSTTEERADTPQDDPLERVRELARRQEGLNRQHRDLTRNRDHLDEEELKRQLERLTREQNELRQQAEQLAQRMQQGSSQSGSSANASGQSAGQASSTSRQDTRRLQEISEDMRNAATGLRRQDSQQAENSGSRASERLRELEREMRAARPDDRRRALGDLQLEARQLADAQRRVAGEAGRTTDGQAGEDARRRLAGDQDRLADRADRLAEQVGGLARGGQADGNERQATREAARDLAQQQLGERMRRTADSLRRPGADAAGQDLAQPGREAARQGEEVARALDRVADRLGAASGTDQEGQRLSDQLARTQELRQQVADLERAVEELKREAEATDPSQPAKTGERPGAEGSTGESAQLRGPQEARGGQQRAASEPSASGREGAAGAQGLTSGGNGRLQQMQREVDARMREAERLAAEIQRQNPSLQGPNAGDGWWRSLSAPGTEAFKQDFARWESLKKNLLVSIDEVESEVSDAMRARAAHERLNAGGHDAVAPAYRSLVDKYYRSLADPRKPR
ncbi:MAG: hypothetical protein ACT4QD_13835 [Acidobacteriota bacterium]